ncbi:MAG: RNA 3'-terminal phosphate cyclase [archaeon]
MEFVLIDGSHGEGGGQIVRTAIAFSTITGKPVRIENIRSGRARPGLKAQHVHGLLALKELCNATLRNVIVGADWIEYIPSDLKKKNLLIDIGTAGSITLVLQTLLLPLLFLNKTIHVRLKGGTDVAWSAPIDHFILVMIPYLRKYADISCTVYKRGYYPKGQGEVTLTLKPLKDRLQEENAHAKQLLPVFAQHTAFKETLAHTLPFVLERQQTTLSIVGSSHASQELAQTRVAERQAQAAKLTLAQPCSMQESYRVTASVGSGITLVSRGGSSEGTDPHQPQLVSASVLGEQGKQAEIVGKEAAQQLLDELNTGAVVDAYTADQLIPFLALSGDTITTSKITKHILSNIYVTEKFLPVQFRIEGSSVRAMLCR